LLRIAAVQTKPVGFSNDFLVGTAGHPFLGQMLAGLPKWNKRFGSKYPTVMFSTGPMFVSYQVDWPAPYRRSSAVVKVLLTCPFSTAPVWL
jgi:mannosyltransferase OCH1-like enzyme